MSDTTKNAVYAAMDVVNVSNQDSLSTRSRKKVEKFK